MREYSEACIYCGHFLCDKCRGGMKECIENNYGYFQRL